MRQLGGSPAHKFLKTYRRTGRRHLRTNAVRIGLDRHGREGQARDLAGHGVNVAGVPQLVGRELRHPVAALQLQRAELRVSQARLAQRQRTLVLLMIMFSVMFNSSFLVMAAV